MSILAPVKYRHAATGKIWYVAAFWISQFRGGEGGKHVVFATRVDNWQSLPPADRESVLGWIAQGLAGTLPMTRKTLDTARAMLDALSIRVELCDDVGALLAQYGLVTTEEDGEP